jgi:SAM-dependent methyltransferase
MFDAKRAAQDLARYRRKGPNPTTILLRDGLAKAGQLNGTLLDVGAGVGALTFELLDLGIASAIAVEASSAFLAAATEEAERRGRASSTQFVHGDFLDVASGLPGAAVVTLDRVICCHPAYEAILDEALRHAQLYFAFSYPRDLWYVRAGLAIENGIRRLASKAFRAFVHPAERMEQIIEKAGFKLASRRQTFIWCADVYVRPSSRNEHRQ